MYRETRDDREADSGWRFFCGHETQAYVDDLRNISVYDVNTIANYSPDIIPRLDAPFGSAFRARRGRPVAARLPPPADPDEA